MYFLGSKRYQRNSLAQTATWSLN